MTSGFLNKIKYILTTIAILNLIMLFGFHYEIPNALKDKLGKNKNTDDLYISKEEQQADLTPLKLNIETDTLSYDGTDELDLLSGVTVTDGQDNPLELTIYASIQNTDDQTTKTILYSVKDEEGNESSAERKLILNNYYGPALSIGQPYPGILDVELEHILEKFKEANLISANDGYGKNITNAVQMKYEITDDDAKEVKITFMVTNHFEDKTSQSVTVPITRTKPLIVLSKKEVTIAKGEQVDPLSYVTSATNEEGEDLTSMIQVDSDLNISTPGEYTITYTLTDSDREQADAVKLSVTVEE